MAFAASRIPWNRIQLARLGFASRTQKSVIINNAKLSVHELQIRLLEMISALELGCISSESFMGYTFSHPCVKLLNTLYLSIWTKVLNHSSSTFIPLEKKPFASHDQLPIMDFVVEALQRDEAFDLRNPLPREVTNQDAYEELLKKSLRFYSQHQETIKANQTHPKMKFARRFMRLIP